MPGEEARLALPVAAYLMLRAMASLVNMHTCFAREARAWAPAHWSCAVARMLWDVLALQHSAFFGGLCLWALLEAAMLWRLTTSPRGHCLVLPHACALGAGLCADLALLAHLAPPSVS